MLAIIKAQMRDNDETTATQLLKLMNDKRPHNYSENWLTKNPWCKSKCFSLTVFLVIRSPYMKCIQYAYILVLYRNENINHNNSVNVLTSMILMINK